MRGYTRSERWGIFVIGCVACATLLVTSVVRCNAPYVELPPATIQIVEEAPARPDTVAAPKKERKRPARKRRAEPAPPPPDDTPLRHIVNALHIRPFIHIFAL